MRQFLLRGTAVLLTLVATSSSADTGRDFESLKKVYAVWDPLAPNNYTAGVLVAECAIHAPPEAVWRVLTG